MNKSIFSWFGYILPLQERLELIKKAGFDGTCLWWEDEIYPKLIPVRDMPSMVRDAGLCIDNIHCPYEGINGLWSDNKRHKIIDTYYTIIEDCAKFDIPRMVMHCTDHNFKERNFKIGIESFEKLVERAEEFGVCIAIENTRDFEIVDLILTEIESTNLGLCYDSSHDFIYGQSEGKLLAKWKNRLFCTHLSDNDRREDKHWIPKDGSIEWEKIMPDIKKSNLENLNMELLSSNPKIEEPEKFLEIAYKRLDELINL